MADPIGANETIRKFGGGANLIASYPHWVVLLRLQQVTLGALVLACRSDATAFSEIPAEAHAGLAQTTFDIETTLKRHFAYDKINYLMLMMVDPHVHFHVLPRYAGAREFAGQRFEDRGWPRSPDLLDVATVPADRLERLRDHLKRVWPPVQG